MPENEPVVQEEQASTEEQTSEKTKEQSQEPLTEERVQQLIVEATAKAVTEAKDAGRRELQGEQDRNKNAERRASFAESKVNAYETSFKGLDEDTQKDIELARFREQDKYNQSVAQEESQKQQDAAYYQRLNESVLVYLDNLGIKRDDKRIDWGTGSQDYIEARNKLDASVAKIIVADKKVAEAKLTEGFKALEDKLRKELNLDSVDTTAGGGTSDSDDFHSRVGNPDHKLTKKDIQEAKERGIIS